LSSKGWTKPGSAVTPPAPTLNRSEMAIPTTTIDRKPPDVERATVTTLVELLAQRAWKSFERLAVVDPLAGRQLSWGQLLAQALAVAERLEIAGLRRGDRLVHVGGHGADWIVVDFACLLGGYVQVALHADSPVAEQAEQLQLFRPQALICSGSVSAPLRALPALPRHEVRVDWSSPNDGGEPVALVARVKERAAACEPDAPAAILISSGTTGRPRGFVHSQRALATNAIAAAAEFLDEPDDVRLAWLPMSHALARVGDLYTALVRGGTLSLVADRQRLLDACRALPPAVILGVPVFFDRLAAAVEAGRIKDLASALGGRVRVCVSGGAPLRHRTAAVFHREGVPLVEGYGLAEAGPVVTVSNPRIHRHGMVGRPLAGIELKIDDRPATRGQVLIRTPCRAMAVIASDHSVGEQPLGGSDWLETGDLGSLDADGQLRISGRLDDVLTLASGIKLPATEVEAVLLEDPAVAQVCVMGSGLPWPVALIVPEPNVVRRMLRRLRCRVWSRRQALSNRRLLNWFGRRLAARQQQLPRSWQVRRFVLVDHPFDAAHGEATESFKVKRQSVAEHFGNILDRLRVGELPPRSGAIELQVTGGNDQMHNRLSLENMSVHPLATAAWQRSAHGMSLGFVPAAAAGAVPLPATVADVVEQAESRLAELAAAGRLYDAAEIIPADQAAPLADAPTPPTGKLTRQAEVTLAETGLWGLVVPEQFGGSGCRFGDFVRVVTRLAGSCPTVAGMLSVHSTIGAVAAVADFGTDQQQQRWLPRLAEGRPLSVFAATEPDAGCDLGRVACRLERDSDQLLLSGTKMFITGATYGRAVKLLALLDGQPTVVLVELPEADTSEFSLRGYALHPLRHAHNKALEFRRFPVSAADVLLPAPAASGRERDGMAIVWHGLNRGRVTLAAQAAGTIGLLIDRAVDFAWQRQTWGEPIACRELVQGRIGRMVAARLACEALANWAAATIDAGGSGECEAILAKVVASRCLRTAAVEALGIHGGRAFLVGHPLGDSFHDHFAAGVYEGESDLLGLALFKGVAKRHPLATAAGGRRVAGWLARQIACRWQVARDADDRQLLEGRLQDCARQARRGLAAWSLEADRCLRRYGRGLADRQLVVADLSTRLQQFISCLAIVHQADRQADEKTVLAATCWCREALAAATGKRPTAADQASLATLGKLTLETR
jgi:long-subunit acyl-CoA synthetase (AMP-forming)/alkylation response protein AidB-like acyl-CoA dehydrogenase